MTTTILRFEKHKYFSNIRQAGAHQHRHHHLTPNADRSRTHLNQTFIGSSNLVVDVKERLNVLTKQPRKNAVLAMDCVLTLSPEVFSEGTSEEQMQTLKKFAITSKRWLIQRFGKNLVNAVLHRDETSPHIHCTIVPLQKAPSGEYKLNARDMFNKDTLHEFQREFFETMQCHFPNLQPPKYREKTTHTTLNEFYKGINKLEDQLERYFDKELEHQKIQIQQQLEGTIKKHIDNWLEQLFIDSSISEKDVWIESMKSELIQKLDEVLARPKLFKKENVAKNNNIVLKLNEKI
ncbi:plasmid recombination protein [Vibrio parahaemolyticus]|nr:plasmid recombination protein [Vibrio parahaemolyticus]HCE2132812.1 plasmid recombination protein [Vibrio parahaemolyticus]HCG5552360.1 plasmid recombination protein [Vibrio parahaemolyticus]